MSQVSVNQLLANAREGDKKAEECVFTYLYERFKAFATHTLGEGDSNDIAMLACKIVLEKYKSEVFTKGFEAWSYGVLQNVIRNHLRAKRVRDKVMVSLDESRIELGASTERGEETKLTLLECMRRIVEIKPRYARVLAMIFQGYDSNEIAERLNITVKNLYVVLNRSRAMLKRCLETGRI